MKTNRRVLIEVETERLIISRRGGPLSMPCPFCGAEVEMAPAEQAARLCGRSLRWVVTRLETEAIHYVETANGPLYICLASLRETVAGQPDPTPDAGGDGGRGRATRLLGGRS